MTISPRIKSASIWLAAGAGLFAGTYAGTVAITWVRYGRPPKPGPGDEDALLDRFIPIYDVAERHRILVKAPAGVTLAAAKDLDMTQIPAVRAIFKGRELLLGATPDTRPRPRGILAETQSLGWVVLAEVPDREIVVGAVTKPWEADVTFRSIAPDRFAAFDEPDYVKIVWTLRADFLNDTLSAFRTETRAVATDPEARRKFRRYWSLLSPGIRMIRTLSLRPVKAAAEAQARQAPARP